jgi:hypothetical protein
MAQLQSTAVTGSLTTTGNVGIGTTNPGAPLHVNDSSADAVVRISKGASTIGNIDLVNEGNRFSIQDDGTRRLSIDVTGNVGINSVSPIQKLDIVGKMRITDDVILAQTNGRIDYDNGVTGALRFFSTSTSAERMRITSAGNVGIGTATPLGKLDVYRPAGASVTAAIAISNGEANGKNWGISTEVVDGGDFALLQSSTIGGIPTPTGANVRFIITNTGNVGIGTANPIFSAVAGNTVKGLSIQNVGNDTQASLRLTGHNNTGTPGQATFTELQHAGGDLRFSINHNGTTALTINPSSNIGIGTANPATKLEIYGTGNTLRLDSAANGAKELLFRNVGTQTATIKTDGDLKLYVEDAGKNILFDTTSGEKMRITAGGNFGMGTSVPVSTDLVGSVTIVKSHNGDTPPSPLAQSYNVNQSNLYLFGRNAGLTMVGASGEESVIAFANPFSAYTAGIRYESGTGVNGGDIKFQTSGTNERMRITSGGLVGIGTSDTLNNILLVAGSHPSGYSILGVRPGADQVASLGFYNTSNVRKGLLYTNPTSFILESDNLPITLQPGTANVGIGTITPDVKLEVNGQGAFGNNSTLTVQSDAFVTVRAAAFAGIDITSLRTSGNIGGLRALDSTSTLKGQLLLKVDGGFEYFSGASLFYILPSGNVGINTDNPRAKLDVNGSIQVAGGNTFGIGVDAAAIYISNNTGIGLSGNISGYSRNLIRFSGTNIEIGQTDTSLITGVILSAGDSAGVINLKTGGNNSRFYITSGGNIGINNTSPLFRLHVLGTTGGDSTFNQGILIENSNDTDGEPTLAFKVKSMADSTYWFTGLNQSANYKIAYGSSFTDVNTLFSVLNTGNVGIGLASPIRKLDVLEGNVQIIANFTNTNTTSARIKFTDANTGAENVNIGATGTKLAMWTNNTVRMTIISGGNVGIGTTNPTHLLHVNGTLRVDNAGSAPANTEPFDPGGVSGYYGKNQSYLLGDPNAWLAINVAGTPYVIPLYS